MRSDSTALRPLATSLLLAASAICAHAGSHAGEGFVAGALELPQPRVADAGAPGGPGLALRAAKILTCSLEGQQVVDHGMLLIKDGLIEAVGQAATLEVPAGYELLDLGGHWLVPGFIDLHSHVGGTRGDINDTVFQTNPGLRVAPSVTPGNLLMRVGLAAGVTTILYIPGSGSNMGGQGVLMHTAFDKYHEAVIRDPGSLKIAQGDNPTRWGYGMGRLLMNYHLRSTIRKGFAYAKLWEAYEKGEGTKPERNIQFDIFRDLRKKTTQVSTHTQYYQLVLMTIQMLRIEFGMDVYIDHGSFDSYLTAELAEEYGVSAILGPREIMWARPPRFRTDGQAHGTAWGFQQHGHTRVGFNTDAPVIPQQALPMQAAMGVHYGFDNRGAGGRRIDAIRGITIVPALTAGIHGQYGSLEAGKQADVLITTGDPIDPRQSVERVYIGGRTVYDTGQEQRLW